MTDEETDRTAGALKVSVLASGKILLDGREVDLKDLEEAFEAAKMNGAAVKYYRENAAHAGSPEAQAVIKLIAAKRLRISLHTQADFSDQLDLEGLKRAAEQGARGSNVLEWPGVETFFAKVRKQAAGSRGVSIVRRDRQHFILPAPPPGAISAQMVEGVKAVVSSEQPRSIAAIVIPGALGGEAPGKDPGKAPALPDVAKRVPFLGLLIGLAYIGHGVWVFEAGGEVLIAGCEEADVLIVDSEAIGSLPKGWTEDAAVAMRNANVLVYDRRTQKVGALRTAGEVPGRIEFPN